MAESNDRIVLFTQTENEFLQTISLDMLRFSSTMNSPDQRAEINDVRRKLEADQYTGAGFVLSQLQRDMLITLIKDLYSVNPRRNPEDQRRLILSILGKLEGTI